MDAPGLLDPATQARLAAAQAGQPTERALAVAELRPGDVGVLHVEVRNVSPARTFTRKRGGEGLLARVTLADATGEVDLVLWDGETRLAGVAPLVPGHRVTLRGATVREGYRGGVELSLGAAALEAEGAAAAETLRGRIAEIGPMDAVGEPPSVRFRADVSIEGPAGVGRLVLWDEALRAAIACGVGAVVEVRGVRPHPSLAGWFLAGPETSVRNG